MKSFRFFLLTPVLSAALGLPAQTPEDVPPLVIQSPSVGSSSPESRLRMLESIYQQQLRSRHIPLLGDYLRELQQNSGVNATPAQQAEIKRVQDLIRAGGLIDLAAAARELNPSLGIAEPAPEKPVEGKPDTVSLTLTPSLAQSILPQPLGSASPVAARIGQMSWRIGHLLAGSYELVLHFASITSDEVVPVRVEFAGQIVETAISTSQATKDEQTYRLLRIGKMKLEKDTSAAVLTLTAATIEAPRLLVRHLVIAPAKK